MTDKQIIKNAEYHKLGNCSRCDYKNHGSNCLHELLNDSIKMAKRLREDVADLEEVYNDGIVCISLITAENKWLLQKLQHAKSEAIREFAERLKSKLQWDTEFENMLVFETDINNLVKEMTEAEK
jgi:hypothetical protein|nr:MAG TPA: hypothetical protein [Caudoviricetes sp.]